MERTEITAALVLGLSAFLLSLCLLVAGCSGSNPLSSILGGSSSGAPSPPTQWTLWFSPGVSLGGGPSFNFPTWVSSCPGPTGFNQTCPAVHYLVNAPPAPPLVGKTITMKFTITGNNPAWNYNNIEQDGNTCVNPANVRFFLQRSGDDWSGTGQFAYYRWWSPSIPLALGTYTLTVPITEAGGWTDVSGDSSAGAGSFDLAANNPSAIGMTFGGGCFAGHGVDLTGGSASFTINSFTVQ